MRRIIPVVLFFLLSGACGLLYQVVWTRKLVLLFGTASYAVSTVLSVFFVGLGTGSFWGGRLADKARRPLRVYGVFEIAIGLWAVLFILLVDSGEGLVVSILRQGLGSRAAAIALRAVLAAVFLFVPVFLMGATLPLLARYVAPDARTRGVRIGSLYSINTFGAVAGCALTGFLLLPELGYTFTIAVGVVLNLAIGLLAVAMDFWTRGEALPLFSQPSSRRRHVFAFGLIVAALTILGIYAVAYDFLWPRLTLLLYLGGVTAVTAVALAARQEGRVSGLESAAQQSSRANSLVLFVFAVSGFCALAFEVIWTRLLAIIFLGTTYAFTTMLATLLYGIAVGSAVAAVFVDRRRHLVSLFGIVEIGIAVSSVAVLVLFPRLPEWLSAFRADTGSQWGALVQAKFFLSFLVLFAPTFLSGMTFPLAVRALTRTPDRLGRDVGRLYSANTLGGMLGALAGGYLLIPLLGAHRGILLLSTVLLVCGLWLILACPTRPRSQKAVAIFAALAVFVCVFRVAPADVSAALNDAYLPSDHRLVDYREGVEGTVAVSEPIPNAAGGDRVLWINAVQATASIEKGVKMNRFQGVLPLLFDRDPRTVLFMCFGSGITAGTLGLHEFERIDAVEISSDVLAMSHHFEIDNCHVADNPRVRFIVDDGRNFLLTTRNQYDVITFEPMPLALAGVSTFYTREYYSLCLSRLAPGGLVSQWVPLHSLDPDLVRSLVRTFTDVFPDYSAWFVNADLFLIGSNQPLRIDYERAVRRLAQPAIRDAIVRVGFGDVIEVLASFLMSKDKVDEFAAGGRVMSDDRPWAEFVAPKLMYDRTVDKTLARMEPLFESPVRLLAVDSIPAEQRQDVLACIERRYNAKRKDFEGLCVYYGGTLFSEPETHFREALEIDPDDFNAQYYIKEITLSRVQNLVKKNALDEAVKTLDDAIAHIPRQAELHLALGDIHFSRNDLSRARACYEEYRRLGGSAPRALERLGATSRASSGAAPN